MKRIFALTLALVMIFALCACGKTEAPAETKAAAEPRLPPLLRQPRNPQTSKVPSSFALPQRIWIWKPFRRASTNCIPM